MPPDGRSRKRRSRRQNDSDKSAESSTDSARGRLRRHRHRQELLDPSVYNIAWIAPLEIEAQAAMGLLDERHHGHFPVEKGDDYLFKAGTMSGFNVIIATFPAGQEYGTSSAAALASQMKHKFPNLWFALLVGVAAGLPSESRDIRLGDVLVALADGDNPAVVDYQLGKETAEDGFQLLRQGKVLSPIPSLVGSAITSAKLGGSAFMTRVLDHHSSLRKETPGFDDPGQNRDILFRRSADGSFVAVPRDPRSEDRRTNIWYGTIGSGSTLLKNSSARDELRNRYNLIGLEMEAAGIMNRLPTGVIRGVCDYGDEQKNKLWQPYAAAMAASYAKTILDEMPHQPILVPTTRRHTPLVDGPHTEKFTAFEYSSCNRSLLFPHFSTQFNIIGDPSPGTALWIQQDALFEAWYDLQQPEHNLLWIKGKPGAGKSTILKSLVKMSSRDRLVASYFFTSQGTELQRSPIGMYRSLVYQLSKGNSFFRRSLMSLWREKADGIETHGDQTNGGQKWTEDELKILLTGVLSSSEMPVTALFIDALDECGSLEHANTTEARQIVFFLQQLLDHATGCGAPLSICVSSRSSFNVGILNRHSITLDQNNHPDLTTYIESRLRRHGDPSVRSSRFLEQEILERSGGIFLWTKLVLDRLLTAMDDGRTLSYCQTQLELIPPQLSQIFLQILASSGMDDKDKRMTMKALQWATFSTRLLRLREWYVVMGLIQDEAFTSLQAWSESPDCPKSDIELEKQIRRISKGLIEVSPSTDTEISDEDSIKAGPGSMISDVGENRAVYLMHTSVREFLLDGGFQYLTNTLQTREDVTLEGHWSIIEGCSQYVNIRELDTLVEARFEAIKAAEFDPHQSYWMESSNNAAPREPEVYGTRLHRSSSVASFHSAASSAHSLFGHPSQHSAPATLLSLPTDIPEPQPTFMLRSPPQESSQGRSSNPLKACARCHLRNTLCDGIPCKRCEDEGLVCAGAIASPQEVDTATDGSPGALKLLDLSLPAKTMAKHETRAAYDPESISPWNFLAGVAIEHPITARHMDSADVALMRQELWPENAAVPSPFENETDVEIAINYEGDHSAERLAAGRLAAGSPGSMRSQILGHGDVTAFLGYSTFDVFKHVDTELLRHVDGFSDRAQQFFDAWDRIKYLREDIEPQETFFDFCVQQRLEHLVRWILD